MVRSVCTSLERFRSGDSSLQTIIELSCYYAFLCQRRHDRITTLERKTYEEVRDIFYDMGLDRNSRADQARYRGRRIKCNMIAKIVDFEYPQQPFIDALTSTGVNAEAVGRYHTQVSTLPIKV